MCRRKQMKRATTWICAGLLLLIGIRPAFAQPQGGPRPMLMLERAQATAEQMDLTPEQKAKINAAIDQAREQMRGMRDQLQDMSPQERTERVRGVLSTVRETIEAQLSPAQKAEFSEKLNSARAGGAAAAAAATSPATKPALGKSGARVSLLGRMRSGLDNLK